MKVSSTSAWCQQCTQPPSSTRFKMHVQDFGTVMAALGSNNERWGINDVTLELQRPTTAGAAGAEEGSS